MPEDFKNNIYPLFDQNSLPKELKQSHPSARGEDFIKEASEAVLKALDPGLMARSLIGDESPARYKYPEPSMVAVSQDEYMACLNRRNAKEEDLSQFDKFRLSNEENLSTLEKISTLLEIDTIEDMEDQTLETATRIIDGLVMLFADINDWQNENTDLVIRVFNWNLKHNVDRSGLWQRYLELSKAYHVSKKRAYDYLASADDGVE